MKKIITKIFVLAFALTLVLVPFTQGYASASSGPDLQTPADSEPVLYNQTNTNSFDFGNGVVIQYSLTAANYVAFMKDRVELVIGPRDMESLPEMYTYKLEVVFYDDKGNVKYKPDYPNYGGRNSQMTDTVLCEGGWPWAADYAICKLTVTYGGVEQKSGDIRLYFWN